MKESSTKSVYQVRDGEDWLTCLKAVEQSSGWLHYELRDGTNGLAQPKNWRKLLEEKVSK
jgi:hypothetical protein